MEHDCPHCKEKYDCGSKTCDAANTIPCSKLCWKRTRKRYARAERDGTPIGEREMVTKQ